MLNDMVLNLFQVNGLTCIYANSSLALFNSIAVAETVWQMNIPSTSADLPYIMNSQIISPSLFFH